MAKEKKPSIYSDRGTIGSSEELDEYGVWVKSEPQDLSSEETGMPELDAELSGEEDMDFTIPEIEDLPDFDPIDDSIGEKSSDDLSLTELPTDDFDIPDIESGNETENSELLSDESDGDDFGLGDLTEEAEFDSLDITDLEESPDSGVLDPPLELTNLEESELEDAFDFPEIDEQDQENLSLDVDLSGTESNDDFAGISMDSSIDDLIENFDIAVEELPDEPMEPMESDQGAVDEEYASSSLQIQTEPPPETGFLVKDSSQEVVPSSSPPDLSTQLLMKIAEELSSIRAELSSLKKEFSGIRAGAPSAETDEGGFFDKEDDEKISLTGDELNNILNTADFTEETGTDVTMGLSDDDSGDPDLLTGLDMEIDTDSTSLDLPEEIGFSEEETEGKEVEPITHDLTTEDTNYLAKEPVGAEGSIDLEEAAIDELIDEPDLSLGDLSSEIQDNLIEESLPDDLSVNLDIEEPISEDTDSEEFGDINISSDDLSDIDISPDDLGDLGISAEELATEGLSSEELIAEEPSPEELTSEELITEEPSPEELTSEELIAEELTSEELITEEPGSEELTSEELIAEEVSPEELTSEELITEEPGSEELTSEELITEEPGSEELTSEELITEEQGSDGLTSEEPGAESFSIEEPGSEELSILELGAGDFDTAEPVFEELGTEPTEEEPVSEEDFEIPVIDEPLEEDFGILVVDNESSGAIIEEAEKVYEEAVSPATEETSVIPKHLEQEIKTVLSYLDQLLDALPDEKIEEFASSEYYGTYRKLFKELGLE